MPTCEGAVYMKCHQCTTPAFVTVAHFGQDVPLCLDCYSKLNIIQNAEFLRSAAMMNQALDDMDMMVPIAPSSGRIPVKDLAKAMQKPSHVYNNIRVSNSQIGVLNTGDLAKIDAVITMSNGSDVEALGQNLKDLTQAVIDSTELTGDLKKEMVDLINVLATQIVGPKSERKPSVIMAIYKSLEERAKGFAALYTLTHALGSEIGRVFG
jgi:hypothetical protein